MMAVDQTGRNYCKKDGRQSEGGHDERWVVGDGQWTRRAGRALLTG